MAAPRRPHIQSALTSFYQREMYANHLRKAALEEPKIPSIPEAVGEARHRQLWLLCER